MYWYIILLVGKHSAATSSSRMSTPILRYCSVARKKWVGYLGEGIYHFMGALNVESLLHIYKHFPVLDLPVGRLGERPLWIPLARPLFSCSFWKNSGNISGSPCFSVGKNGSALRNRYAVTKYIHKQHGKRYGPTLWDRLLYKHIS